MKPDPIAEAPKASAIFHPLLGNIFLSSSTSDEKPAMTASRLFDIKSDSWLQDHAPGYLVPVMPFTVMVSSLMEAARTLLPDAKVVGIENVCVTSWLSFFEGPQEIKTEAQVIDKDPSRTVVKAVQRRFREAPRKELSRYEPFCEGKILLSDRYPSSAAKLPPLPSPEAFVTREDFYASPDVFHGPRFQLIDKVLLCNPTQVISFIHYPESRDLPPPLPFAFILDASLQTTGFFYALSAGNTIPGNVTGIPYSFSSAQFFGEPPQGRPLRCEVSAIGLAKGDRFFEFAINLFDGEGENPPCYASFRYVAVLIRRGALMQNLGEDAHNFLKHRRFSPHGRISTLPEFRSSRAMLEDIKTSDVVRGSVARTYLCDEKEMQHYRSLAPDKALEWLGVQVAARDLVAQRARIHPSALTIEPSAGQSLLARSAHYPCTLRRLSWSLEKNEVRARLEGDWEPDPEQIAPLIHYWSKHLEGNDSPPEKVTTALLFKFLNYIYLSDPKDFQRLGEKSCIYLANHQTYLESILFVVLLKALRRHPLVALAKREHRNLWVGPFDALCNRYPGATTPPLTEYADREDPNHLLEVIARLTSMLKEENKSILVHVEGTRQRSAHQKIQKLSSIWGDISIKTGKPIVPVRFVKGLPPEDEGKKFDFPYGYGKQAFLIGKSIWPEELSKLPYVERSRLIKNIINGMESPDGDAPTHLDASFETSVEAFAAYAGVDLVQAAIFQTLSFSAFAPEITPAPGIRRFEDPIQALIAAGRLGLELRLPTALVLPETPEGFWMKEFATWLFGPKGPIVCTPATIPSDTAIQVFWRK